MKLEKGEVVEIRDLSFIHQWRYIGRVINKSFSYNELFLFERVDPEEISYKYCAAWPITEVSQDGTISIRWDKRYLGMTVEDLRPLGSAHYENKWEVRDA